jgi:coupling of ubiquitin conjugation to ER degradation protein 1
MTEQSINIPQVLVFLVVTFLAIRWYFSKPSAQGTRPTSTRAAAPRLNHRQIDDIAQMFPQLSRRDIAWDLQRNGGNAAATTERVLSGRGLDTVRRRHQHNILKVTNNAEQAPPSFNLPTPRPLPTMQTAPRASPAPKTAQPDLITRYNLAAKLQQTDEPAEQAKPKAWSADRNERQANLQRRREEMVLAARRKLEMAEKGKGKAEA